MEQMFALNSAEIALLRQVVAKVRHLSGPGVTHSPAGIHILPPRRGRERGGGSPQLRLFRVLGATAVAASNDANDNPTRWLYTAAEAEKTAAGYGGWSLVAGAPTVAAYNLLEDGNTGTGRQRNGVDHDGADYPAGFAMRPIQTGSILPGLLVYPADGGVVEAWLMPVPNGEDGSWL